MNHKQLIKEDIERWMKDPTNLFSPDYLKRYFTPEIGAYSDKVQFRFPKSKKKRIRKKWYKNPKNWKSVPKKQGYMFPMPFQMFQMEVENRPPHEFLMRVGTRIHRPEDFDSIIRSDF